MDGRLIYHRNTVRRFLPRPASGMPLLFTLSDCCDEEEQIQVVSYTESAKFVDWNTGSFFPSLKQFKFARGFDNNMPDPDNAVDYAEQL